MRAYEVLYCTYDSEVGCVICYYFDTKEAEDGGVDRDQLMGDLEHDPVRWSDVTEVVEWINGPE
jgi:hypothetical protein